MMHEWVAAHGSHDQRERLSAGVLPFEEFVDALSEVTFRPLSHLAPYQTDGAAKMQAQLRQLPGHANVVVTPNDLSLVNEIRGIIPGAQVQLRERSLAWTREAHAPRLRLVSALVTTRVGPVLLRREFHVPDSAPDVPARTQEDELMKA